MKTTETTDNGIAVVGADAGVKSLSGRIIGITHRIKMKKDETARPTLVAIRDVDGSVQRFELETEQSELDFLNGKCAVKWRDVILTENISGIPEHQIIFRAAKAEDALIERHESQCHYKIKKGKAGAFETKELVEVATKQPIEWIGIQRGDMIAMMLGGSGDYFAYALSRKLTGMAGVVVRIPPFKLDAARAEGAKKDDDAILLATLASQKLDEFYETQVRDRGIIRLRNEYRLRMDTMKARIGCEQRLFQRHIGSIFCSEQGYFPEGSLIKAFDSTKATDAVFQALLAEEKAAEKRLVQAVEALDVYEKVFGPIKGIGPMIAARIINSVIDIRRFKTKAKFAKFLGVHVILKDAEGGLVPRERQFPRRRNGQTANWHPDGRQAMYLLGDQFLRQSDKTHWGRYLIAQKMAFRARHPEEEVGGKKRYTKGHIQKMALWRTLTRFAGFLYREWSKLEKSAAQANSKE